LPDLHGIDVSEHQRDIDWPLVASQRPALRFVISRMSHGGHGNDDLRKDPKADQNRDGMRSAFPNTPRGFFHFLGSSDPVVQVRHFQTVVGALLPGEFVMLDVEPDDDAHVGVLPVEHIVATLEAIEERFGLTPWLYIGRFYPGSLDRRLHRFPLSLPVYDDEPTFRRLAAEMGRPVMVWQWGGGNEGAIVAGVATGRVDSNQIIDEEQFRSSLKPAGPIGPGSQPDDDDMRYKLFKPAGFFDVLAVGPGNPFNPGSPEAAQELVDQDQVADRAGNPVRPGTDFTTVRIEVSVPLWTAMNSGVGPIARRQ
jgi:GH25 family lysozyme M1 (1,4-beta-N-acetylmuramidase)